MSNEATADTNTDSLAEFETRLADLRAEADDAVKFAKDWEAAKSIKKGSALATYVDEALTNYLTRRVDECGRDADRLEKQVSRMKIAAEQRALKAQIAANEQRLKALTS